MNEHYKDAKEILKRFQDGLANKDEERLISQWFEKTEIFTDSTTITKKEEEVLFQNIKKEINREHKKALTLKVWKYSAAVALFTFSFGMAWYFVNKDKLVQETFIQHIPGDALPSKNTATLELSNGKIVELSDSKSIDISIPGIQLDKQHGVISFVPTDGTDQDDEISYSTIKTKNGTQYNVVLPDGSLVKLSANSSIRFPNRFEDKRRVEVKGEAYFDVKRDATKKFIVYTDNQFIEVLGTQFNIKAYDDEKVTTTALISGSLLVASRIKGFAQYTILKPGQIAVNGPNRALSVHNTHIEKEKALQRGDFHFDGETLPEILTILSRWYDVSFIYEVSPSRVIRYGGVISRDKNLSSVLKLLEDREKLEFVIKGKEVVVKKRNQ